MRVFILCTGRSGSSAIIKACKHISNYTCGHESQARSLGSDRFDYPDHHIEADNRLSWHLGQLDELFGDDAFYVHLTRDHEKVARSFMRRYFQPESVIDAYAEGVRMLPPAQLDADELYQVCKEYVDTIHANISLFLKDKTRKMVIDLGNIEQDFTLFWKTIGAKGELDSALKEFRMTHNASRRRQLNFKKRTKLLFRRESRHIQWWMRSYKTDEPWK